MATLTKVKTTYYVLPSNSKQKVPKSTPGAKKKTVVSKKWYIVHKVNGKVCRLPAYTDKQASQAKLADLLKAKERGEAGLSDPYQSHYDRPIMEHLREYHAHVCARSKDDTHKREVLRILTAVLDATKIQSIREITMDKVSTYLTGMNQAAGTKNMHRRLAVMFTNWLETNGRLPSNPIGGKKLKTFKIRAKDRKRKRRSISAEEIQRLLTAAREQPLKDASVGAGGRKAKDGTRKQARPARLKPTTIVKLERRGRERQLLYRLAICTGLRRKELSRLRVHHLDLAREVALIILPCEDTKNDKPASIALVPSLATELKSWIADTGRGAIDELLTVPDKANLSKIHQRLLKLAQIEYKDQEDRYADFHALRKSANVVLRKAGIPLKDRMTFLRHGSASLTDGVYEDENQTDRAGILTALAKAGL
jgi:integrase